MLYVTDTKEECVELLLNLLRYGWSPDLVYVLMAEEVIDNVIDLLVEKKDLIQDVSFTFHGAWWTVGNKSVELRLRSIPIGSDIKGAPKDLVLLKEGTDQESIEDTVIGYAMVHWKDIDKFLHLPRQGRSE